MNIQHDAHDARVILPNTHRSEQSALDVYRLLRSLRRQLRRMQIKKDPLRIPDPRR